VKSEGDVPILRGGRPNLSPVDRALMKPSYIPRLLSREGFCCTVVLTVCLTVVLLAMICNNNTHLSVNFTKNQLFAINTGHLEPVHNFTICSPWDMLIVIIIIISG
jgi:hypothetical protein